MIDDIFDIKKNINNFLNYFKYLNKNNHCPIIITLTNTINKKMNNIIKKCYQINIKYSQNIFNKCVQNILHINNLKLDKCKLNNLINNSNNNFNSINENIKYLKHKINNNNNNNNNTTKYLITINDINKITQNLIYEDLNLDISKLFNKYNYDVNIVFFNIIDNILNITKNIDIILNLYNTILYINYWENYKNKLYLYNNDLNIFYYIIYPISKLKNNKLNKSNIKYNKYISYSLQYIYSINNYNLNPNIYYYFIKYIFFYNINKKESDFLILKEYIKNYKLNKKNINNAIKLYYYLNNIEYISNTILINKLFN